MTDEKKTPLLDFSKIVAPRRPNVEANMYAGQEFTPEAAAVGVRAQRDHGIPASMAAADNTMVPTPKLDFSAINKSKPLANYASTPAGAAVIRDDITGLSALDDVLRAFGRDFRQQMEILSDTGTAIKSGLARSDANIYGFLAAPFGVAGQAADPLVGKVIPNNPFSEGESFLLGKSKEMAGFADAQLAPVLAKQKGYAKDAMEGLASLFPSATGMALAAVTKNPALAYGVAGAQSGGAGYAQARQEGLSPLDSMMYGTNAGMISAVSEMIPAIKYVEDMAAGTKLHKVIVGQLATEMPGEQFDAHMGDLNEWAYLNPDKTLAEYAAERPDVAIKTMVATIAATVAQTAAVSTTASVVTEVGEMKKRRDVATRAEAAQKSVKAMAEHIKATKMLGRDPDGLAGLVTQIAEEGGAPSTVYIDAADLTGVLLQSNMTIHDMAELIPAVGPQMVDAFMAGGTVEIPVGEALVRLSGTAIEEAMMPHIRLEADGYSAEQAKKFVAEYEGQQMAKAEGILKKFAEDSEFRQSAARIRRQVQDELTAIDPASPESAATRAKLFEAFFVTAARDWGGDMTPGKLFDRLYKGRPVVVGRDSQQAGGAVLAEDPAQFTQEGARLTDTPEFTAWSNANKLVSMDDSYAEEFAAGEGVVVEGVHATTADFTAFDKLMANPESDLGAGFYATNTTDDAASNYAGEHGPDLAGKIQREAEGIASETDREYDDPEVIAEARSRFMQNEGLTMPVFIRFDNPAVLGGSKETFLSYEESYDPETDEYGEPEGELINVIEGLREAASKYEGGTAESAISSILEEAADGGITASRLIDIVKADYGMMDISDDYGQLVINEVIRQAFESAGFDGFIDQTVNKKFGSEKRIGKPMEGMNESTVHYIAFNPTQIKSKFNRGTFDGNDANILNQSPVFYSALERGILGNEKLQKGTAEQWLGFLSKLPGVKRDEIDAVGLPDFLALQTGAITRDQVLEFVRGNGVQIKDVINASPGAEADRMSALAEKHGLTVGESVMDDSVYFEDEDGEIVEFDDLPDEIKQAAGEVNGEVKYGKYQLPGGKNYRELLLTLPVKNSRLEAMSRDELAAAYEKAVGYNPVKDDPEMTASDLRNMLRGHMREDGMSDGAYQSGHWDAPNVLAHVRFNERTGANGERILHLEEVQSDWHQAGRKEGYRTENEKRFAGLVEQRDALDKERLAIEKKANDATSAEKQRWADLKNQIDDVQAEINKMGVNDLGVPDAPFKETSAWSSLAIKRMLRYAVDNGFDAVTWTGGEVQADRYTEADSEKMAKRRAGMIAFYDKMLPQFTNGVIKKMGGKVETIEATSTYTAGIDYVGKTPTIDELDAVGPGPSEDISNRMADGNSFSEALAAARRIHGLAAIEQMAARLGGKIARTGDSDSVEFLGFRINDQMRDQVAAGQALFQPDNGQAMPRGTFRPSDLLMTLSKTRNASTFLHEAGHGFLDMTMMMAQMPDAPKEIQKRADDILAWMGITGTPEMSARETWMNMTLDEKRPYHEKWAETFEAYLMRGESPSLELSEAFSKFRDWLVSIYKTITEAIKTGKLPNASLNREVINIMDRLLATDQQIAEARAARAVIPLFTSKPEGMTVEAWREYQAQVGAQDAHDKHVIDRKKLSDMQWVRTKGGKLLKELQKAAAEKRKEMKIRARAAIMSQPAYIARKILTSRVAKEKLVKEKDSKYSKDIDLSRDSAMIAIAKAGGMNEALFVAEYGIDPADFKTPEMRAGHKRQVMVKRGGLRPGDVGEMLAELGYIPVDADGKFENQAVEDLLDDEARGNPRYSYEADYGKIYAGDAYSETQQPDINSIETLAARLHRDEMHQFRFIDGIEKLAPMIADRGYPAEALAGMVGFESGEQMIRALIETKDINIAIEELTDKLMLDKYGDLSSPEALQRAVDEAMAGPARLRFLATEISIAEKSTGNRQNIYRAAKEAARNILSGIKVSAVRPDKYRVAATRASREAAAALGRGESDAVVKNKRTEALNTALFMEASAARDEIKKKLTSFRKKLKGKDEDIAKTRNMDLVNVARTILSDFGMLSEAGVARSGKAMDILKQYNPEIAQVFEDIVNDLPPAKNYKDLTLAEFRAVVQTVEAVLHRARQEKRIQIEDQQYDMDEFAATVVGKLGQAGAVPAVMESTLSTKDRMVRFTMGALAHLRRAESFLELASGLDIDIFRPVNNAVRRHFQSSNGYLKEMTELLDSIKKDLSSFPIVALPGELGPKGFKFNKGKLEILHVILHMGNDSNKGKLVLGRNWGSNPDGTPDFSGLDRFIARMIDEGVITKNDMDFVQSVWDLMEKMKPDAQKAHKDMFGFHFDEITASPIVTKFGVYRGGYVPAIGDRTSALVAQRAAANELYDAGSGKMFPTTGRGFAKSRVKWDVPLELNIGLLTSHIDSVSRFTYVEPTVREIARLLNRGDVSNAFVSYHPLSLQNIINPWLESSAKQTIAPPSATPETDAAINWMNSTAGASMMAGNIANVIQQFTGFGFAAIKVRPDYLMRALFTTTRQPVSLRRNIANLDPFMKERLEGNQFELQRHIRAVVTGNGPLDTVKKGDDWIKAHAYFAQLWAQRILDPIIWQAAYDQAVSKGSADPVGDAGAAVRNTQGSFGAGDLSNIEKGSAWWRVSMKFYSYFSMQINTMTTESAKEVREKGFVRAVPRLAYMWFIVYAVTNMVAEGIMTGFPGGDDDDDEDGIFDEWMAMYFGASFRVGTASVPGVGAAAAAVAGSFDDQPFNDRLNVSPLSSYLSRALKGGIELFVPEEEGDEEFTVSEMKSLMALFGIMGLPTGQVGKTAGYVMQVEAGAIEPETEFDYLIGLARGR